MFLEAILAATLVALASLAGVFFFGNNRRLLGAQRFVVPIAVGVFLSLVLYELIPETLKTAPEYGGVMVALGFIAFYILSNYLHQKYHHLEAEDCDRKGAATMILVGDAVHNLADGVILGAAFIVDPAIGVATAIGLALHEIPQEIVEFGVLIRAGHSKAKAALLNLLSASSIIVGTILIILVSEHAQEYVWVITGLAAGNLLYLAASELLPKIHGNLPHYGSVWRATLSIILGFVVMTAILQWTHENYGHGHVEDEHQHDETIDEHHDELE